MIFASDNWAGASDRIVAAFSKAASQGGPAYGEDPLTVAIQNRFNEIFERDVTVFLVASGTVANALALAAYARPGGIVFAHRHAHIAVDEAGAVEFFSGGNRIVGIEAAAGKLSLEALAAALEQLPDREIHHGQPVAVSLTQVTEFGVAYRPKEIAALADLAKSRGIAVHMDGARFAGAVAGLGLSPADLTWRAGVDVLSLGGTKNGCFAAEAVIFFDPADARDFAYARQRAGQGYSKNWFIAAQFAAYFEDDHWLDLAGRANRAAARLAEAIESSPTCRLVLKPDANEVFAILDRTVDQRLRAAGAIYHPWRADGFAEPIALTMNETMVRIVTSFETADVDVERFAALL